MPIDVQLTLTEVATICGVDRTTILRQAKRGTFPAPAKVGAQYRWSQSVIEKHLNGAR